MPLFAPLATPGGVAVAAGTSWVTPPPLLEAFKRQEGEQHQQESIRAVEKLEGGAF
jgi:hypothetical protein